MIVSVIAAIGKNYQLGLNGKMPWHHPEDLKYFKKITMNHHLIMGRKTYESIGFPLPNRKSVILTKDISYSPANVNENVSVATSVEQALNFARARGDEEVFFAGGSEIYKLGIDLADRIYLTRVEYDGIADIYFPIIDFKQFKIVTRSNGEKVLFEVWERN